MKRSGELRKPGNVIPSAKGRQKNKHIFHELKLQRAQKLQEQMEARLEKVEL